MIWNIASKNRNKPVCGPTDFVLEIYLCGSVVRLRTEPASKLLKGKIVAYLDLCYDKKVLQAAVVGAIISGIEPKTFLDVVPII